MALAVSFFHEFAHGWVFYLRGPTALKGSELVGTPPTLNSHHALGNKEQIEEGVAGESGFYLEDQCFGGTLELVPFLEPIGSNIKTKVSPRSCARHIYSPLRFSDLISSVRTPQSSAFETPPIPCARFRVPWFSNSSTIQRVILTMRPLIRVHWSRYRALSNTTSGPLPNRAMIAKWPEHQPEMDD